MKKIMKRMMSFIIAAMMIVAMAVPAMAGDATAFGSIEITTADKAVPLTNRIFTAFKILNATVGDNKAVAYTVPEAMKGFFVKSNTDLTGISTEFENIPDDNTTTAYDVAVATAIGSLDTDVKVQKFAEAAVAYAVLHETELTTYNLNDSNNHKCNVDYGYYVIKDMTSAEDATANKTAVSAVIIESATKTATVVVKATVPTVKKEIVGSDITDEKEANTAAIGDTVSFKITSNVPDTRGYDTYTFKLNDTLSQSLDYVATSLKVTINGTESTAYTSSYSDHKLVIDFTQFVKNMTAGQGIVVTYQATVNDKAVITSIGNTNDVYAEYSNDPSGNGRGESTHSTTKTFTTALKIAKQDQDGKSLTGAAFTLTGTKLKKLVITVKNNKVDVSSTETESEQKISASVGEDGYVTFTGLAAGNYTLTESTVPAGYNPIDPIKFTITAVPVTEGTNITGCTFTANTDTDSKQSAVFTSSTSDLSLSTIIQNRKGTVLPSTGGMGTTIFTIIGIVLMAGAAIVLITKKRLSNKQ